MLSDILNNLDIEGHIAGKTVLIVGATGFIGSELGLHLTKLGCTIRGIDNSAPDGYPMIPYPCDYRYWDHTIPIPIALGYGVDVVINAAGTTMTKCDWTPENLQAIIDSRVEITKRCVEFVNHHKIPIMIQNCWTGYYGNTNDTWTNESFPAGNSMTAQWCVAWENATSMIRPQDTRLVIMRTSPVISTTGGILMQLVDRYMLGIGASLRQHELYMSWIHVKDFLTFINHAIVDDSFQGIYNVCSAFPITYSNVHKVLHEYYPQGVTFSIPTPVIKAAAGDKAKLVLQSSRILPKRLMDRGFVFQYPHFDKAVKDLLNYRMNGLAHSRDRFFFPAPRREVYQRFAEVKNWPALYPDELNIRITDTTSPRIKEGTEVGYRVTYLGVNVTWREKVYDCDPGHGFRAVQLYGPFNVFEISRTFTEVGDGTLLDVWQRYKMDIGAVANFLTYKRVAKIHKEIREHQRQIFNAWYGTYEPPNPALKPFASSLGGALVDHRSEPRSEPRSERRSDRRSDRRNDQSNEPGAKAS